MATAPDNTSAPWRSVADLAELADTMTFGAYMRAYRLGEGWSQAEAGQRLGISKQLVSQYELGKSEPSLKEGLRIATMLDMPLEPALHYLLNAQLAKAGLEGYQVMVKQLAG